MDKIYVAMDWAQASFAIAWQVGSEKMEVFESSDGIKGVKSFLSSLEGKKIFTFEEGTASQWLYTELKPYVDELIVCNTRRNKLLSEGAKNDRIDACKLLQLLKADLLKPVFHTFDKTVELRKIVGAYNDYTKASIRLKNQKSAVLRSLGKRKNESLDESTYYESFLLKRTEEQIELIERHKSQIKDEFRKIRRKNEMMKALVSIPGIGEINSVRIVAVVVDPNRFKSKHQFLSYCGLVKHERASGGTVYSYRSFSYNRDMKSAFKTAALVNIMENSESYFNKFYQYKLKEGLAAHDARNATARRIATIALGIMKTGNKFNENKLKPFVN